MNVAVRFNGFHTFVSDLALTWHITEGNAYVLDYEDYH